MARTTSDLTTNYADGVTFHVFELADGGTASASAPALDGSVALSFKVRREGQQLIAEAEGATKPWVVLLRGITDAAVVEGGVAQKSVVLVRGLAPAAGSGLVKVSLR